MLGVHEFWTEIVEPNCRESASEPSDLRLLYNACITLYALLNDYLNQEPKGTLKDLKNLQKTNEFKAIKYVCNAAKHKKYRNKGDLHVSGTEVFRPPSIIGQAIIGLSILGDESGAFLLPENTIEGVDEAIDLHFAIKTMITEIEKCIG